MWTTSDGHALTLPRSRLAPIISQMRKPEMKDLVKRNYQGDLRQAVVRSLGQLARNAHRTGNLRHRKSNRRYPVFTAGLNGREYEIITSPVGSTQNAIVSVSAELEPFSEEFEAGTRLITRSVKADIKWHGPYKLEDVPNKKKMKEIMKGGGVYVVEKEVKKKWEPIYVGEAVAFEKRWDDSRFELLRNLLKVYRLITFEKQFFGYF